VVEYLGHGSWKYADGLLGERIAEPPRPGSMFVR